MSDAGYGLMLALMHPPPGLEEEFSDWYDTEHLPQRRGLPGFIGASRWVCIDGFPGSLAAYDLASLDALNHPAYLAVSGANSTPWSRRILGRTARAGRMRVEARQVWPGTATALPQRDVNRLVVARYRAAPVDAVQAAFGVVPTVAQLRVFQATDAVWVLAELGGPASPAELFAAAGRVAGSMADVFNVYLPYTKE